MTPAPVMRLRRYQQLGLDAFEADRAAGRRHTHIVAPPGSGKTIMGLEIARRIGAPAVVLCPTAANRAQWAAHDHRVALTALTYQAICQTDDPGGAQRSAAEPRGPPPGRARARRRAGASASWPASRRRSSARWPARAARATSSLPAPGRASRSCARPACAP